MTPASERLEQIAAAARKRVDSKEARKQQARVHKALAEKRPANAEPDPNRRLLRVQAIADCDATKARQLLGGESPDNLLAGDELFGAERLIGDTVDFVPASFLIVGQAAASAVGRVIQRSGQPIGSGFLISGRLFVTNNHVIGSADEAGLMLLELDYETDLQGLPRPTTRFAFDPGQFFVTNDKDDLDFTVVAVGERVAGNKAIADYGICPLSDRGDLHMLGEYVNVVQHPEGDFKQLVLRENKLVSRLDTVLHYEADTQPGSSGSPVFNDEWEAVALHHWGGPHREQRQADGTPVPAMVNEGIRISAIVKELAKVRNRLKPAWQALLDQALALAGTIGGRNAGVHPASNEAARVGKVTGRPQPMQPASRGPQATVTPVPPALGRAARVAAARVNPDGSVTLSLDVNLRIAGALGGAPAALGTEKIAHATAGPVLEATGVIAFSAASLSASSFDWQTALSTALACQLSYQSSAAIQAQATGDFGLQTCEVFTVGDIQCFVASSADTALVTFRGSANLGNWFSNIDILTTRRPYGLVHRGFFRAMEDVQDSIMTSLAGLNKPRLVVSGHSLGGAMATLFSAEAPDSLPIKWIYTFGQPASGVRGDYVSNVNARFGTTQVRFVNNNDIVPRVPPFPYKHVGRLVQFDANGNVSGDPESLLSAALVADGPPQMSEPEFRRMQLEVRAGMVQPGLSRLQGEVRAGMVDGDHVEAEGIFPSFADHAIAQYVAKTAKQLP